MTKFTSATKALASLLLGVDHKTPQTRAKVCKVIYHLIINKKNELFGTKELDTLKLKLEKMLTDSCQDCRAWARDILKFSISNGLYSRSQLESVVSCNVLEKALEMQGAAATLKKPNAENLHYSVDTGQPSVIVGKSKQLGTVGAHTKNKSSLDNVNVVAAENKSDYRATVQSDPSRQNANTLLLDEALQRLSSKLWSDRIQSLGDLTDIVLNNHNLFAATRKIEKCIESIVERLEDGHIKVLYPTT